MYVFAAVKNRVVILEINRTKQRYEKKKVRLAPASTHTHTHVMLIYTKLCTHIYTDSIDLVPPTQINLRYDQHASITQLYISSVRLLD